jgi:CHAD domain-containing protein
MSKQSGKQGDNHSSKLLLTALEQHGDNYRKRLKKCRKHSDEPAVHKARTAARRLLAVVELLRAICPKARLGKLRQRIKAQLVDFNELRDTQVMLLETARHIRTLPALTPFQHALQNREQLLMLDSRAFIRQQSTGALHRQLKKAHRRCKRQLRDCDPGQPLNQIIASLNASVLDHLHSVNLLDLASIHPLRIATKKLRYTLSAARHLLPAYPPPHYEQLLNHLQVMGELQNSAVIINALEKFYVQGVPLDIQYLFQQQQVELLDAFTNLEPLTLTLPTTQA